MYMSCTFNMFVYICILIYPKFFCWGFSPPTWPKKHDISSILSGIKKHNIIKSRQPEKKNVSSGNQTWHGTPHLQWDNLLIGKL